jgi:hypothetical protein
MVTPPFKRLYLSQTMTIACTMVCNDFRDGHLTDSKLATMLRVRSVMTIVMKKQLAQC